MYEPCSVTLNATGPDESLRSLRAALDPKPRKDGTLTLSLAPWGDRTRIAFYRDNGDQTPLIHDGRLWLVGQYGDHPPPMEAVEAIAQGYPDCEFHLAFRLDDGASGLYRFRGADHQHLRAQRNEYLALLDVPPEALGPVHHWTLASADPFVRMLAKDAGLATYGLDTGYDDELAVSDGPAVAALLVSRLPTAEYDLTPWALDEDFLLDELEADFMPASGDGHRRRMALVERDLTLSQGEIDLLFAQMRPLHTPRGSGGYDRLALGLKSDWYPVWPPQPPAPRPLTVSELQRFRQHYASGRQVPIHPTGRELRMLVALVNDPVRVQALSQALVTPKWLASRRTR